MSTNRQKSLKDIISETLEIGKAIDEVLSEKKKNITLKDIPGTNRKEIEASVWNNLGLYFLNNRMYLNASKIYRHMLQTIREVEQEKGVEVHKGLPLHNMGVAQINLKNFDEGIPNILKAYEEDTKTYGSKKAESQLAYRVKEGLIDFVSRVIDNNYLKEFNNQSGFNIKNTMSLMQNMNEAEKLFFAKIVNSKKLVTFHDDIYTRVTMLDNLKNLCLILESNLKRRSGRRGRKHMLFRLVTDIFAKEKWQKYFVGNRDLTGYKDIKDFQDKLEKIENLKASGKTEIDFITNCFLTATLVRNFTAHYMHEKLDILEDSKKYDRIFAREIFSILYSLACSVK